jgi:hypothetical protein
MYLTNMDHSIQASWLAKRDKAIERFVAAWNSASSTDDDFEPIHSALDAVTVAHIAVVLDWQNGPSKNWIDKEAKAMKRLTATWDKYGSADGNLKAEEELNIALDDLAVAHIAVAFEGWRGKLKW